MFVRNLILISALQLSCGLAFSQEVEPKPTPDQPKEQQFQTVEEPASFPGGRAAMSKFLADNLKYPKRAAELELEGKCFLQFVVTETGDITDVKVKKGVPDCPECDAEAIRVVKAMPQWTPGKIQGKAVKSYYNLPLSFKLP